MADSLMVKEIFEKLNEIQYISNITPVLSVVIVAFLGWYFSYRIHKSDKKDKYLFSLAKEKFAAAQTAFNYSIQFISIIHGDDNKKFALLDEATKWFNTNNLYLHSTIRKDFKLTINKLHMYKNTLELFYQFKKNGDKEKAEEQNKTLKKDFEDIVTLNNQIQKNIDIYYS